MILPVLAAAAASTAIGRVDAGRRQEDAGAGHQRLVRLLDLRRRGIEKAQTELPNYNVELHVLAEATAAEQRRVLDDLLTSGVAGVSVSVNDPRSRPRS